MSNKRPKLITPFLLLAGIGLIPIGLMYGFSPKKTLPVVLDFMPLDIVQMHILRAIMGLYLTVAGFWIIAAFKKDLQKTALWIIVLFMYGLAFGRIVSLIVDGVPPFPMFTFLGLELVLGSVAATFLKKLNSTVE